MLRISRCVRPALAAHRRCPARVGECRAAGRVAVSTHAGRHRVPGADGSLPVSCRAGPRVARRSCPPARAASGGRRWWRWASCRAAREWRRTRVARPSPRGRRRTRSVWRCASRAAGASARRSPSPRRGTSSTSASPSPRTGTRWWRGRSGRRGACAFRWRGARPAPRSARRRSSCRGVGPLAVRCSSGWRRTAKASWSSASRWAPRSTRRASTPCASARAEHRWARPRLCRASSTSSRSALRRADASCWERRLRAVRWT